MYVFFIIKQFLKFFYFICVTERHCIAQQSIFTRRYSLLFFRLQYCTKFNDTEVYTLLLVDIQVEC